MLEEWTVRRHSGSRTGFYRLEHPRGGVVICPLDVDAPQVFHIADRVTIHVQGTKAFMSIVVTTFPTCIIDEGIQRAFITMDDFALIKLAAE